MFSVRVPTSLNSLPDEIRKAPIFLASSKLRKIELFKSAFCSGILYRNEIAEICIGKEITTELHNDLATTLQASSRPGSFYSI